MLSVDLVPPCVASWRWVRYHSDAKIERVAILEIAPERLWLCKIFTFLCWRCSSLRWLSVADNGPMEH